MTVTGAAIRVQCYRKMGKQFTSSVTLLKDHKLITSGPYLYVRYPSYTGAFLNVTALVIWYTAPGSWLREGGSQDAIGMAYPGPSDSDHFLIEFTCAAEDEILRKAFGKEWDEWARIELCQEFIDAERV